MRSGLTDRKAGGHAARGSSPVSGRPSPPTGERETGSVYRAATDVTGGELEAGGGNERGRERFIFTLFISSFSLI